MLSRFSSTRAPLPMALSANLVAEYGAHERHGNMPGHARDINDRASTRSCAWPAPAVWRQATRAEEIRFEQLAAFRNLHIRNPVADADARIVDPDVEPAEAFERPRNRLVNVVAICARRTPGRTVRSGLPMRCRASSARATSRDSNTTFAPLSANILAIASPMPIEAPVTTTTLPVISIRFFYACARLQVKRTRSSSALALGGDRAPVSGRRV